MLKKITFSIFLLLIGLFLFPSCDKDNFNKKLGQYAIGLKYKGNVTLNLQFFIDGKESGTLQVVTTSRPSPINDCKDLKKPENLINVFVIKDVAVGKHQLEIKNSAGVLLETLQFNMSDRECVFQEYEIPLDKMKNKKPAPLPKAGL